MKNPCNTGRSNKFNIKIDLDNSHDSFLWDKNTERPILDFLGMFASLPLGYNHPVFKTEEFEKEILRVAPIKVTNCFIGSDESIEFDKVFTNFAPDYYTHFYYCCTGSLAIESAMKVALEGYCGRNPKIVTFKRSFHGINGWASFVTSRQDPVGARLEMYPKKFVAECEENISDFLGLVSNGNVAAVLIEPIRATFGDLYFNEGFLEEVCSICKQEGIPVIFDEVQTGMGATGTYWYHEQLNLQPDIVVFGKKSQLSGIMVSEEFSDIFKQKEKKLEATWDATLVDMIRCKHIIKAYQETNILENVNKRAKELVTGLYGLRRIRKVRHAGLLVAFDLDNELDRNKFQYACHHEGLLVNSAGKNTIRLRPPLSVNKEEVSKALDIMRRVCYEFETITRVF